MHDFDLLFKHCFLKISQCILTWIILFLPFNFHAELEIPKFYSQHIDSHSNSIYCDEILTPLMLNLPNHIFAAVIVQSWESSFFRDCNWTQYWVFGITSNKRVGTGRSGRLQRSCSALVKPYKHKYDSPFNSTENLSTSNQIWNQINSKEIIL